MPRGVAGQDFGDFVFLHGRMYFGGGPAKGLVSSRDLGAVIGRVTCSYLKLAAANRWVQGPPREGNAVGLPTGIALHRVHGYPMTCRIAARAYNETFLYFADDADRCPVTGRR